MSIKMDVSQYEMLIKRVDKIISKYNSAKETQDLIALNISTILESVLAPLSNQTVSNQTVSNQTVSNQTVLGLKVGNPAHDNISLLLIYDMTEQNDYAKSIFKNTAVSAGIRKIILDFESKENSYYYRGMNNSQKRAAAAEQVIEYCNKKENRRDGLLLIFWSLMVLTADDSNEEEKLSLISDFASLMKIEPDEMKDMIELIMLIYKKTDNMVFRHKETETIFAEAAKEFGYVPEH